MRFRSKKTTAKKAEKRRELEELYDVSLSYWRYEGRKGVYWHVLSQYIRMRDFFTYGTCISCGKKFNTWKDSQAGHYAPAGNCGFGLVFDKRNIHGECPPCNNPVFSSGKLIPYRTNLVKRYGEEWVKQLDEDYKAKRFAKEWNQKEYDSEIRKLQAELAELIKQNEIRNRS